MYQQSNHSSYMQTEQASRRDSIAHYYPEVSWPTSIWTPLPWTLCQSTEGPVLASTLNLTQHYYDWQYHEHMKKCDHQWLHAHMKSMRTWEYIVLLPWSKLPDTYLNAPVLDPLSVGRRTGLTFTPESYTTLLWLTTSWTHEQHEEVWPSTINTFQDVSKDAFEQPKGHTRWTPTQLQTSNDIPVDGIDPNPKP